jgi:hypothetical protein
VETAANFTERLPCRSFEQSLNKLNVALSLNLRIFRSHYAAGSGQHHHTYDGEYGAMLPTCVGLVVIARVGAANIFLIYFLTVMRWLADRWSIAKQDAYRRWLGARGSSKAAEIALMA